MYRMPISCRLQSTKTQMTPPFTRQTMQLLQITTCPHSEQTCELSICNNLNHTSNFGRKQMETDVPFCIVHYRHCCRSLYSTTFAFDETSALTKETDPEKHN